MNLKPGEYAVFDKDGFHPHTYFALESYEHPDSYEDTVKHVRDLVEDCCNKAAYFRCAALHFSFRRT